MISKMHITGASGSGTTTLGKALAQKYKFVQLDSDNYFWLPTNPPYQKIRKNPERQALLNSDMLKYPNWVSTGSLCSWRDFALPYFDLVIFLFIPQELRIKRLIERENIRSPESFIEGTVRAKQFNEFIDWAKQYDTGGLEVRSLYMHKEWLKKLSCPVLNIEGELTVDESVKIVENFIIEL